MAAALRKAAATDAQIVDHALKAVVTDAETVAAVAVADAVAVVAARKARAAHSASVLTPKASQSTRASTQQHRPWTVPIPPRTAHAMSHARNVAHARNAATAHPVAANAARTLSAMNRVQTLAAKDASKDLAKAV